MTVRSGILLRRETLSHPIPHARGPDGTAFRIAKRRRIPAQAFPQVPKTKNSIRPELLSRSTEQARLTRANAKITVATSQKSMISAAHKAIYLLLLGLPCERSIGFDQSRKFSLFLVCLAALPAAAAADKRRSRNEPVAKTCFSVWVASDGPFCSCLPSSPWRQSQAQRALSHSPRLCDGLGEESDLL